MEHIRNLLAGAAGLFGSLTPRSYPASGGFAQDRRAMRSDWKRVGDGLRGALKDEPAGRKHVKPTDSR